MRYVGRCAISQAAAMKRPHAPAVGRARLGLPSAASAANAARSPQSDVSHKRPGVVAFGLQRARAPAIATRASLVGRDATIGVGKRNLVVLRSADVEAPGPLRARRHELPAPSPWPSPEHYAAEHKDIGFEIYPAAGEAAPDSGLGFIVADLRAAALTRGGHVRRPRQLRPPRRGAGRDDR